MNVSSAPPIDQTFLSPEGDEAAAPEGAGPSRRPDGAGPSTFISIDKTLGGAAEGAMVGSAVGFILFGNPVAGAWVGGILGGYFGPSLPVDGD